MPNLRRLSADDLRLVVKVEPELQVAAAKLVSPDQVRTYEFDTFVQLVEATPEFKGVFDKHQLNAREFFRNLDSTILALQRAANLISLDGDVMRANVVLVLNPPEDIATALVEWRRTRLGF